jgi:hypothetical protein
VAAHQTSDPLRVQVEISRKTCYRAMGPNLKEDVHRMTYALKLALLVIAVVRGQPSTSPGTGMGSPAHPWARVRVRLIFKGVVDGHHGYG